MANQLFDLLKQDHQQAKQLMEKIASASANQRQSLFIDLNDALTLHMQMEEKFFYPQIQNEQGLKQLAKDALQEHQEAKDFLRQLDRMDQQDQKWTQTFKQMQQGVLHHVQEEEGQIFPKCTRVLNENQLNDIAQKCRQMKEGAEPGRKTTGRETEKRA